MHGTPVRLALKQGAGNMIASEKFDTMCFSKGLVEAKADGPGGGRRIWGSEGPTKRVGDDFFVVSYSLVRKIT